MVWKMPLALHPEPTGQTDYASNWIVCQLGAREHYGIARELHRAGKLSHLLTDAWMAPGNPLGRLRRGLGERYHPELADASVRAPNFSCLGFELLLKLRRRAGWSGIMARNAWFQQCVVQRLSQLEPLNGDVTVFAYSYAAREILSHTRARGWKAILGQIDPGPTEERIVKRLYEESPEQAGSWTPVPPLYWQLWREECELADAIVVNSIWSKQALEQEGVTASKLVVAPLAYAPPVEASGFERHYPETFSPERPLRVLFLGQVNLRKGARPLLEAARLMRGSPIEFWFVGDVQILVPTDLVNAPNIKWVGPVPRSESARYYREADVFILPTFSDGFGLTQLEAQAWKLPVIASRYCGDVVTQGQNGLILDEITPEAIRTALGDLLERPAKLRRYQQNSVARTQYAIEQAAWIHGR
jgi:glycosyltransferase involved in cell wall biosynthesis